MKVNILEAKNRLSELIRAASRGEEVLIANRGQPVVRLVSVEDAGGRPSYTGAAIVKRLRDQPLPDYVRRTESEIDAAIEEDRAAWD